VSRWKDCLFGIVCISVLAGICFVGPKAGLSASTTNIIFWGIVIAAIFTSYVKQYIITFLMLIGSAILLQI
jgi:hypothetical protein